MDLTKEVDLTPTQRKLLEKVFSEVYSDDIIDGRKLVKKVKATKEELKLLVEGLELGAQADEMMKKAKIKQQLFWGQLRERINFTFGAIRFNVKTEEFEVYHPKEHGDKPEPLHS